MSYLLGKQCFRIESWTPRTADCRDASRGVDWGRWLAGVAWCGYDGNGTEAKADNAHITLLVQLLA